jgi:hypothetical protein
MLGALSVPYEGFVNGSPASNLSRPCRWRAKRRETLTGRGGCRAPRRRHGDGVHGGGAGVPAVHGAGPHQGVLRLQGDDGTGPLSALQVQSSCCCPPLGGWGLGCESEGDSWVL